MVGLFFSQKIQPVRADGNLLLCTLLLGNVAVNALLSIVMAELTSGLVGFALATVIITIFGEIIPQVGVPCRIYVLLYCTMPINPYCAGERTGEGCISYQHRQGWR